VQPAPIIDLQQKPIVAKLVRLGEKRPEHLLPRKEEPPPPAAADPVPQPAPQPAQPAPAPPAARVPAPAPRPKPAPPRARPAAPGPRSDAFGAALARVRRDQVRHDPVSGDPEGDPMGDASEGQAGDRYLALMQRALHDTYRVPPTISERERLHLRATVVVFIEPDGKLSRWSFRSKSGNGAFDDALARAIQQARFPPPPTELRQEVRSVGMLVNFGM